VALGVGNLLVGLIRGFPVSSSGSRTSIGDAQGSRTQLHSLVAVVVVVLILAFGQAVLAAFPTAALGAVVIYAALRLIDVGEFRRIARFRWSELAIALITTVAVVVLGVLYGVIAAVAVSVVELLYRLARPHDAVLGLVPGVAGMHDLEDYRGMVFATARVKQDLRDVLTRAGLVELIGEERMYMTLPTAVSAYREWVAAQP